VTVKPKKSETGADERRANNGQLASVRIEWDLQIFRDPEIAGGIGQQRVGPCHRHRASNRQTVETVREVHRIGRSDNDQREK